MSFFKTDYDFLLQVLIWSIPCWIVKLQVIIFLEEKLPKFSFLDYSVCKFKQKGWKDIFTLI